MQRTGLLSNIGVKKSPIPNLAKAQIALRDLGNGAVDTTATGIGAPTFARAGVASCRLANGNWNLTVGAGIARSHYLLGTVPAYMKVSGVTIGGSATSPDIAAARITGNIRLQGQVALDSYTPAVNSQPIIAKWTAAGNQRSYFLAVTLTTGTLIFQWSVDGISIATSVQSTVALPTTNFNQVWVRADFQPNNGAGGNTTIFYTSPDGVTWTQLGAPVTQAGTTSIFAGTAVLESGSLNAGVNTNATGKIYRGQIFSGIGENAVLVADFNPSRAAAINSTSFVASTGETWTINGLAYIGANPVYGGYLAETAATQLLTAARDLSNAAWTKTNINITFTSGLDGGVNNCSVLTATLANGTCLQALVLAAASRTFSAWVKRSAGTGVVEITQDGGATWTPITAQINGGVFVQVELNASILNPSIGFRLQTNGDAIIVDCAQYEDGPVATTPIGGGARLADALSYASTLFPTVLSSYCEFSSITPQTYLDFPRILSVNDGTAAERTGLNISPGTYLPTVTAHSAGVAQYSISSGAIIVKEQVRQIAARHYNTTGNISNAGTLGVAVGPTTAPVGMNSIQIGSITGAQQLRGTIKNIRLYDRPLSDAQLQALT